MKAQHIFVMLMVIFQISFVSASQSGSLMDIIESSVNSFHQSLVDRPLMSRLVLHMSKQ